MSEIGEETLCRENVEMFHKGFLIDVSLQSDVRNPQETSLRDNLARCTRIYAVFSVHTATFKTIHNQQKLAALG